MAVRFRRISNALRILVKRRLHAENGQVLTRPSCRLARKELASQNPLGSFRIADDPRVEGEEPVSQYLCFVLRRRPLSMSQC
jgi:hypothetical protein